MGGFSRAIAWLCASLIPVVALAQAYPQTFPARPLRLIVPFPAGLPPAILKRIHAAALNSSEVTEPYPKVSGAPMPSSPEELSVYLAQDPAKWGAVVKAIGFKAD